MATSQLQNRFPVRAVGSPSFPPPYRIRVRDVREARRSVQCVAHSSELQRTEIVFGLCLFAGFVCELLAPSSFVPRLLPYQLLLLSACLISIGVALIVIAKSALVRAGQPVEPGFSTGRLVTTGLFGYSRNPIYTGSVLILFGSATLFDSLWILAMAATQAAILYLTMIIPEERYLESVFGVDYRRYRQRVRRWL